MLWINGNNIKLTRGDSMSLSVQIKDSAGDQIDLVAGDKIYFTVKTAPTVEEKILQKEITTFAGGLADVEIAPADTSSLACGSYHYDIQYTRADGYVQTIVPPSRFEVAPEVTYE